MAGLQFWEIFFFYVTFEWVQRGLQSEKKGKVIPCRWTENRKGAGTNSGQSGARNQQAESIWDKGPLFKVCIVPCPVCPINNRVIPFDQSMHSAGVMIYCGLLMIRYLELSAWPNLGSNGGNLLHNSQRGRASQYWPVHTIWPQSPKLL